LLEKKWTKKRINLCLDFDEFIIKANEDMFKQVWFNLLDNAIKFCIIGGDVKVGIEKEPSGVSVTVQNTGSFIPESEYGKIFGKFYRVEGQDEKEGNGIGLSIVKHIVDLHDGRIFVKSVNNVTAFTVVIPENV